MVRAAQVARVVRAAQVARVVRAAPVARVVQVARVVRAAQVARVVQVARVEATEGGTLVALTASAIGRFRTARGQTTEVHSEDRA